MRKSFAREVLTDLGGLLVNVEIIVWKKLARRESWKENTEDYGVGSGSVAHLQLLSV